MPSRAELTDESEVTQKELATLLGVTSRSVYNFRDEGMPSSPRGGKVLYSAAACIRWYIEREVQAKSKERGGDGTDARREIRQREEAAKADKAETDAQLARLELQKQLRLTMRVDDSAAIVEQMLSTLNAGLGNFPGRWSPELVALETTQAVRVKLDAAIAELRSSLCAAVESRLDEGLHLPSVEERKSEPPTGDVAGSEAGGRNDGGG